MNFFYEVIVPKETEEQEPYKYTMKVDYGVITNVTIVILPGHAGLTHFRVFYHEIQLYPHNPEFWYKGDGLTIKFNDNYPIDTPPYELVAYGYNEDIRYNHAFLVDINVIREFAGAATEAQDYAGYIGAEG